MHRFRVIVFAFAIMSFTMVKSAPSEPVPSLENVLAAMAGATDRGGTPGEDATKTFYDVLFNPSAFKDQALRIAVNTGATRRARELASISMATLPRQELIGFFSSVFGTVARQPASPDRTGVLDALARLMIYPPVPLAFENDPRWRAALQTASQTPDVEKGLKERFAVALALMPVDRRFRSVVEALAAQAQEAQVSNPLLQLRAFQDLYADAASYVRDAGKLILDPTTPPEVRNVAVVAMQGLPEPDLFAFLGKLVDAAADNRIDPATLELALFPPASYANGRQLLFTSAADARRLLKAFANGAGLSQRAQRFVAAARRSQDMLAAGITYVGFTGLLDAIVPDLDRIAAGEDEANEAFLQVFGNPSPYASFARRAMLDSAVGNDAKLAACLAMQRLPQHDLLELLAEVLEPAAALRDDRSRAYDTRLARCVLAPPPMLNAFLSLYYDKEQARGLLEKAKRISKLTDELRSMVEDDLSGKGRVRDIGGPGSLVRRDYVLDGQRLYAPEL